MNEHKRLRVEDFEEIFGGQLSSYVKNCIGEYNFEYSEINESERDELLLKIFKTLFSENVVVAGEQRIEEWEAGWSENLNSLESNNDPLEKIVPKYFNKYNVVRWGGRFIQPIAEKFEKNSLSVILDWLFDRYARSASDIYEFGCGTGHNLLLARQVNPDAKLWGLDWTMASQKIIAKLRASGVDEHIYGHNFDYFNPDKTFQLAPGAIIYTVASLEQIGDRWGPFVEYLLQNKPALCIHVEPIGELLDESVLLDFLSVEYFKKRNYLSGFLNGLKELEKIGKVKIHQEQRTHIGSLFIEGYSVVVWSPI
jgi:SAM-dependent methyltransferase